MIEFDDVPDLVDPVVIAAFEGWNDAADAASVGRRPPDGGVEAPRSSAPSTPRSSTTSRSTGRWSAPTTTATAGSPGPRTQIAVASPARPRPRRHPGPRHRAQHAWRQFCAELLAACDDLGGRARGHPRRAAGRHPAHPPDPGHRHRHRARAGRPAQARAVDVRGPDRHRRRLPGRVHPARHPGGVLLGRGPPLRRPAAVPQGHARPARPARGPARGAASRSATCPRTPGPGSAASTSSPRRTRTSPTTSARSRRPATPPTSPRPAARRSRASSSATSSAATTTELTRRAGPATVDAAESRSRHGSGSQAQQPQRRVEQRVHRRRRVGVAGVGEAGRAEGGVDPAPGRRRRRVGASRSSASAASTSLDDRARRGRRRRGRARGASRRGCRRRPRAGRRSTPSRCGSGGAAAPAGSPSGRRRCCRSAETKTRLPLRLRHLLAVVGHHPGVGVGPGEPLAGVGDLRRGRRTSRGAGRPGRCRRPARRRRCRGGRARSRCTRCASRAGRGRTGCPTPARPARSAAPHDAVERVLLARRGRGRRRARRRSRSIVVAVAARTPRRRRVGGHGEVEVVLDPVDRAGLVEPLDQLDRPAGSTRRRRCSGPAASDPQRLPCPGGTARSRARPARPSRR